MKKILMAFWSIRDFVSFFFILTFSIVTVYFYYELNLAKHYNRDLLEQVRSLHNAVDSIEKEKDSLRDRVEKMELEKQSLAAQFEPLKSRNAVLKADIRKMEDRLKQALDEKAYLEDILIHKTREIESLQKSATVGQGSSLELPSDLSSVIQQKDEEIRRLTENQKALRARLDKIYQTTHAKISEINNAKSALEESLQDAKSELSGDWKAVDLGSIAVRSPSVMAPSKPKTGVSTAGKARKEGRVLAVNTEHGFVVVDLGAQDGISQQSKLTLAGKGIDSQLSVIEVRDGMTACNIQNLPNGQNIKVNDLVLIR